MSEIEIRPARPDEAAALGELALRAKGYWGYDEEFLKACREELTYLPEEIESRRVSVVTSGDTVVGFYSLDGEPPEGEIGNMWIDPKMIGTGLGRRLWDHAIATANTKGFTELRIEADPNAEGFYRAMGAERIGEEPSGSIAGRMLPLLRITLPNVGHNSG